MNGDKIKNNYEKKAQSFNIFFLKKTIWIPNIQSIVSEVPDYNVNQFVGIYENLF